MSLDDKSLELRVVIVVGNLRPPPNGTLKLKVTSHKLSRDPVQILNVIWGEISRLPEGNIFVNSPVTYPSQHTQ